MIEPSFAGPLICLRFDVTLTRLFGYCSNMRFPVVLYNLSNIPNKKWQSMPWFSWPAIWKCWMWWFKKALLLKCYLTYFHLFFWKIFKHDKLSLIFHLKWKLFHSKSRWTQSEVRKWSLPAHQWDIWSVTRSFNNQQTSHISHLEFMVRRVQLFLSA